MLWCPVLLYICPAWPQSWARQVHYRPIACLQMISAQHKIYQPVYRRNLGCFLCRRWCYVEHRGKILLISKGPRFNLSEVYAHAWGFPHKKTAWPWLFTLYTYWMLICLISRPFCNNLDLLNYLSIWSACPKCSNYYNYAAWERKMNFCCGCTAGFTCLAISTFMCHIRFSIWVK